MGEVNQLVENQRHLPSGCIAARPEKDPRVAGKHPVSKDALRARLGPVSWLVWWHAEQMADRVTGNYFEGRERAAKELRLSAHAVKRAIGRLVKAGLVVQEARRKNNAGKWIVRRTVRGHFAQVPGETVVLVPAETALWLKRPEGRGGRRAGAGRHPGSKGLRNSNTAPEMATPNSNTAREQSNTAPPSNTSVSTTTFAFPYGKAAADAAPPLAIQQQPEGGSQAGFAPAPAGVQEVSGPHGDGLRGKLKGGGPPPPGQGGVPRFPGPTVLLAATVPGPREIPEDMSEEDAVEYALKAYRGAVEARTKKKCWVFCRKGEARKSKHWAMLVDAVRTLREQCWAPGSWVLWSSGLWHEKTKKAPPLKYIFNSKFMLEQANWFEREAGHYQASRIVYNDVAKAILRRYQRMQEALVQEGAVTSVAVKQVVERFFPGDAFKVWVARANARTQDDQRIINNRIQRGDFLW